MLHILLHTSDKGQRHAAQSPKPVSPASDEAREDLVAGGGEDGCGEFVGARCQQACLLGGSKGALNGWLAGATRDCNLKAEEVVLFEAVTACWGAACARIVDGGGEGRAEQRGEQNPR